MDDAHCPDNEKGDAVLPPLPWHQRTREFPQLRDVTPGKEALLSASRPEPEPFITLGRDAETEALITIGDTARRDGFYVLGITGMGKSTLLVNLLDLDIEQEHSVCFLDLHGDAIAELLDRGDLNKYTTSFQTHHPESEKKTFMSGIYVVSHT